MKIGDYMSNNKSELAFGAGIFLGILAPILAAKHSPKAKQKIDEAKKEKEKLTAWDYCKLCWKDILPSAIAEVGSLACFGASKKIDGQKIMAVSAAYEMTSGFLKTYSEKVKEQIGEVKNEEVKKEALIERSKNEPAIIKASEDISLYDGDCYFKEPYTNHVFISSKVKTQSALNVFNARLNSEDSGSLNDFFSEIWELTPAKMNLHVMGELGDYIGFNRSKGLLDLEYEPDSVVVNGKEFPAFLMRFKSKETGYERMPVMFFEAGE